MLHAYLASIANQLDHSGHHAYADAVDNMRMAQLTMPDSYGQSYDKASAANQEVQKLAAQQASMLKATESDLKDLKEMQSVIVRGARDFWRFRRYKHQGPQQPQQPQVTDLASFGLRGVPAPQMRKSQTEVQPVAPVAPQPAGAPAPAGRTAPAQSIAPFVDEVEEFFQWLEAEQAKKMQQNSGMNMNMNLPFQIG